MARTIADPLLTRGKLVIPATIPKTGLVSLSLPLAHYQGSGSAFAAEGDSVIDVINDHLS